MPKKIVIGYDGSIDAQAAAAWALDESARTGAPVEFVHAREPSARWTAGELEQAVRGMLGDAAALARRTRAGTHMAVSIVSGPAATVLIERSASADLIVLGSCGRGSVSVAVSAHARCPVIVVRADAATNAPVVVGVDDSVSARSALAFAADQAARRGVAVRAIRAGWPTVSARQLELFHAWTAQCRREHPGLEISAEAVVGSPARVLVRASADAQLVVVGSRGRGAARRALLGSVSRYLLSHCTRNLAVVHGTNS